MAIIPMNSRFPSQAATTYACPKVPSANLRGQSSKAFQLQRFPSELEPYFGSQNSWENIWQIASGYDK